jgi:hypothetical protein
MYLQFTPYLKKQTFGNWYYNILLISIFRRLIVALYLLKKYSFKARETSLGGDNVLFNGNGTYISQKYKKSSGFKKSYL